MIETLPEVRTTSELEAPGPVAAAFQAFRGRIRHRSLLVWGEHCQECAYPSCYVDCAFYAPRSDFHCRRFENGIEPLKGAEGLHRVRFRKWGKLEAKGPTRLHPLDAVGRRERLDHLVAGALGGSGAPLIVRRSLSQRWNRRKADGVRGAQPVDGSLVVEGWSPDGVERSFTLTILNEREEGRISPNSLFQTRFTLGADYRRLEAPVTSIAAHVDLTAPYLVQIEPIGEAQGVDVVFGVCDFVRFGDVVDAPVVQAPAKVLVWDLDETLWDGVLAEDGVCGLRLRPEAAAAIRSLDERGIIQTIASKNDHAEAMAALEHFGLAQFFLCPQIHYSPKSASLAEQSRRLGLALDSFVFIDDQAFERAEVQGAHGEVRVLSHEAAGSLAAHPWFLGPVTDESRRRRLLYREEELRTVASASAEDYETFLRGSDLRLDIAPLEAGDLERVFELSQRTNQLNFNGRRFTPDEIRALACDQGSQGFVLRCADRFGDYGLIGFAVVDLRAGRLEEFFMSCRVQRKRVEHAFFNWFSAAAAEEGACGLTARHTPSARNGASADMLGALGFEAAQKDLWRRPLGPVPEADVVTLTAPVRKAAA